MRDPTQRFSDRVEKYAKYRPAYPAAVYAYLHREAGLQPGAVIADIGSGTGLSSQSFLAQGHQVLGVEPNAEMRAAAELIFARQPLFVSVNGRAESTTLPEASVDFIIAAQAFHWFDPETARLEFERILRPGGQVALIWNRRDTQGSSFQNAYEQLLLTFGTDFKQVDHQRNLPDEKVVAFFAPHPMKKAVFAHEQSFNEVGLRGRLLSSSYAPTQDSASHSPMISALHDLFEKFQREGFVTFSYQTTIYHGLL